MLQHWRIAILVTALAATGFLAALGSYRLFDEDEPRNAACGKEMLDRGDWVVPTFNDKLSTDKPILLYWGMLVAYHLFGVTELAARLPSALAGVGTVVLTFQMGRLMFDSRTGFLASCLTASALNFAVLARAATPDSLLILCTTASLLSFVAGVAARRGGHFCGRLNGIARPPVPVQEHGLPLLSYIGIYLGIGFAVLAKGPIGIVMPIGIIGSFLLLFDQQAVLPQDTNWLRRFTRPLGLKRIVTVVHTLRLSWGMLLVALITLPWYTLVALRTNGDWVIGFLGTHNIGRFLHPMEHHHGLPIYYLVAIVVGFFPGSVFLPVSLWTTINEVREHHLNRSAAAFLLCWSGCFVGFFSLAATKLPNYVVPCYPALAIACGSWLSSAVQRSTSRDWRLRYGYGALTLAGVAIAVGLSIAARRLLNVDTELALPGAVVAVGGVVSLALLYRGRVEFSVAAFTVTCFAFTLSATTYTASRATRCRRPHC